MRNAARMPIAPKTFLYELDARTGVAVSAVCPAFVDTEITRQSAARIAAKTQMTYAKALKALLATEKQKRLITPQAVAKTVVALCAGAKSNGRVVVLRG